MIEALTWPQNRVLVTRIKSAASHNQRPTAALLAEPDPTANWNQLDYKLQEAMDIMDREICPRCKNPYWLCHSTDNRIDFIVETGVCYASQIIEEHEKTAKPGLGEYFYAKAIGLETDEEGVYDPLPSRLEAFAKFPDS